MNQMTVVSGSLSDREFTRESLDNGSFRTSFLSKEKDFMAKILALVTMSINVNSTAAEELTEQKEVIFSGSKTEVALLNMTRGLGHQYAEDREKANVVELYPFSSEVKSMSVVIKVMKDAPFEQHMKLPDPQPDSLVRFWLFVKGAAEIISQSCNRYLDENGVVCCLHSQSQDSLFARSERWMMHTEKSLPI